MNLLSIIIIILGFLARSYRLPDLLGFYFDQGRDALTIWELWHTHKLFLIGPTTGIEGIFLGPFYYYLIAPFYLLGNGNPVYPAFFLAILNTIALMLLYLLTKRVFGNWPAFIAVLFSALSFYNIFDQRWLSNPNPLTFFSLLIYWFLYKLISGKGKYLPLISLLIGISLQFEAASAVFFIPSLFITLVIFRKSIKINPILLLISFVTFIITLMPQLIFDFRHQHILLKAFDSFLFAKHSFSGTLSSIYPARLQFFSDALIQRLFVRHPLITPLFLLFSFVALIVKRKHFSQPFFIVILIWITVPVLFLSFYTGNQGYVWDYYFTGIFPLIYILAGVILSKTKYFSLFFITIFLYLNLVPDFGYLNQPLGSSGMITLGTSLHTVDWVYNHAQEKEFNVDVYVPPVVPYSYNYLFLWRGSTKYKRLPSLTSVPALYTIYEQDGQHPQYLDRWLNRQDSYGAVSSSYVIGGVTAQSRLRYGK